MTRMASTSSFPRPVPANSSVTQVLAGGRTRMQAISVEAEDPDGDIVRFVNAGDLNAALRSLMQRHGASVYRYCRGALHDPVLAEDVHQQIFIEAHLDFPRCARFSTVRTWLFTIARYR